MVEEGRLLSRCPTVQRLRFGKQGRGFGVSWLASREIGSTFQGFVHMGWFRALGTRQAPFREGQGPFPRASPRQSASDKNLGCVTNTWGGGGGGSFAGASFSTRFFFLGFLRKEAASDDAEFKGLDGLGPGFGTCSMASRRFSFFSRFHGLLLRISRVECLVRLGVLRGWCFGAWLGFDRAA